MIGVRSGGMEGFPTATLSAGCWLDEPMILDEAVSVGRRKIVEVGWFKKEMGAV